MRLHNGVLCQTGRKQNISLALPPLRWPVVIFYWSLFLFVLCARGCLLAGRQKCLADSCEGFECFPKQASLHVATMEH
eukprot:2563160-Amphidinium_carterae.1